MFVEETMKLCRTIYNCLTAESARLLSEEGRLELLGLSTVLAVRKSELKILMSVHDVLVSLKILIFNNSGLDDLDGTITSTVSTSHLLVALLNSTEESVITILLVHVVSTGTRVVSQPDTVVLDFGVSLVDLPKSAITRSNAYLVDSKNLTSTLLHLLKSVHEVPITGLSSDSVGSEKTHSVNFRFRVSFSRKSTTNNVIIVNLEENEYERTNFIFNSPIPFYTHLQAY